MGKSRQIIPSAPSALRSFAARTLVVIPAHNEVASVGDVVRRLRDRGFPRIRVVDNGSQDGTAQVAVQAGAEVILEPRVGYGLACWLGGLNLPADVDWILYCNGDGSDDLEALDRFAELAPDHDFILGARTDPRDLAKMSRPQRFGNWLAPTLIAIIWGRRFADLGPQRAIRVPALARLGMRDRGFGWTVEMQVRAVEEGLRIAEIPVRSYPRVAGISKISGNLRGTIGAGVIILKTLGLLAVRKLFAPRKAIQGEAEHSRLNLVIMDGVNLPDTVKEEANDG